MTALNDIVLLRSPTNPNLQSKWKYQLLHMRIIGSEADPYIAFLDASLAHEFLSQLDVGEEKVPMRASDLGPETNCDFDNVPVLFFSSPVELAEYFADRDGFSKSIRLRRFNLATGTLEPGI